MKRRTAGHKQDADRKLIRYTVWDNLTDKLLIADGTGPQCAAMMGISYEKTFLVYIWRMKKGKSPKRWTIEATFSDEIDLEGEDEDEDW